MSIPEAVLEAARARAAARAARDWATADRLRGEIEAAGWRVIDRGTDFRLQPAHPPDVDSGGVIRYGRSEAVPSRLGEPATGPATILAVLAGAAGDGASAELERSLAAALAHAPAGVDGVVVGDGLDDGVAGELATIAGRLAATDHPAELVLTSAALGHAAALNAGLRRARGAAVVLLDSSVEPRADVVGPLIDALADASVAVAGPFGLVSGDLRRFEEVVAADHPLDAVAIQGYLMAFRRSDVVARGPLDEAFRYYRNLDVWWSLVLRDEGEGRPSRRALVVPGLDVARGEPRAWALTPEPQRQRLSKRNFYRVLDRFRSRLDLAATAPEG